MALAATDLTHTACMNPRLLRATGQLLIKIATVTSGSRELQIYPGVSSNGRGIHGVAWHLLLTAKVTHRDRWLLSL